MLLALSLLALAASPQDLAQDLQTEKPQHRVLFLRGGAVMRGLSRPIEGGWQVRRKGQWTSLPDYLVLTTEMERESEKEFAKRLKVATPKDPAARAQAAGWALEHGLLAEGIKELDSLLRAHPDLREAREAVMDQALRFKLPAVQVPQETGGEPMAKALEPLLEYCSLRGPSLQELGVVQLAELRDREALLEALTTELGEKEALRRGLASLALRRLFPGKSHEPLILHSVLDPDEDVRTSVALTLASAQDTTLILPLVKALDSSHHTLRVRAAEALGNMNYPAAVEPLVQRLDALARPGSANAAKAAAAGGGRRIPHSNIFVGTQFAYIQDFDVEIAQGSSIADPIVNVLSSGVVLDVAVVSVAQVQFTRETRTLRVALGKLTGIDPGNTNRAWLRWWEKNGSRWSAASFLDPQTAPRSGPSRDGN